MKHHHILLATLILTTSQVLHAGDPDSPANPDDDVSRLPSLTDIYNRLDSGGGDDSPTGPFSGPVSGPGSTGYSLQQVMDAAPQPDNSSGAGILQVLQGRTFWGLRTDGTWGPQTGTMTNVGQENFTPGTTDQGITAGYHDGTGKVAGDSDLAPASIRQAVDIFGVVGNLVPSGGTATPADVASGKTFYGLSQTDWVLQVGTAGVFECEEGFLDLNGRPDDECEFQVDDQGIYIAKPAVTAPPGELT